MSDPNVNLERWIFASVDNFFETTLNPLLPLTIEGRAFENLDLPARAELRITGPTLFNQIGDYWKAEVNIDILVQVVADDVNYHTIWNKIGIARESMQPCIPVYRYGNGGADDETFVANLKRYSPTGRAGEEIRVTPFGRVEPEVNLYQATVDAFYKMEFKNQ